MRKAMRYRMLDVRIWCDEKFRLLTPLKPSGQALFLYLLSNPHTTSIPGLYRAGAAAMAEELGWPLAGFRRTLKEVMAQGLVKADLKARVIFISNAMKYNKPQSPNVVRSWAVHWDEIPECALKSEAYYKLESFVKSLGKAFAQAFAETLCQRERKASKKSLTKSCFNQEQKQAQECESDDESQIDPLSDDNTDKNSHDVALNKQNNFNAENLISSSKSERLAIPLNNRSVYQVTKQEYEKWQTIYPKIDVLQELRQLIAWNLVNPDKRKAHGNILRHIHTWLAKEQRQKIHQTSPHPVFPVTFEHNLQIAKKWLTPNTESDKRCAFKLLTGKKIR